MNLLFIHFEGIGMQFVASQDATKQGKASRYVSQTRPDVCTSVLKNNEWI